MADGDSTGQAPPTQPMSMPLDPNTAQSMIRMYGQQDTSGMTTLQPELPQRKQPEPARTGGSIANIMGLVQNIGQKLQARKQRETGQLFDKFTQSYKGSEQAKSEMQEAQEALKKNPQDQKALQAFQKARQSFDQNKTILQDMFSGPHGDKHYKTITKGYGIDDKNANTPERQAAKDAWKKSLGVDDRTAGILSRLPMTQGLSPDAQRQAMLQQSGVVGKPATGGQILAEQGKERGQDIAATTQRLRTMASQGIAYDKLQMVGQLKGITVSRGQGGEPEFHVMSPEERSKIPYLKAQDDLTQAKTETQRAMYDAKMNPNNPEMRIKMMDAQSKQVDAEARMLAAQAAQMRAMAAQAKEPPEVAAARKQADQLETEYAKAQQYVKTPSPTNDTALVFSYVRAQVAGAGRMTNTEIQQAMKSGSFGTKISNMYNRATKGELDPDFRQELADSIGIAKDKARMTADKYDVQKSKEAAPSFDELQKQLEDLSH